MTSKKIHALDFISKGFWVFPLRADCKGGERDENGNPIGQVLPHWPEGATNDPQQVESWWNENPEYNIGVACHKFGPDGKEELLCLDVDVKPEGGIDGRPIARRLEEKGIIIKGTYTQNTPSGGTHIVYRRATGLRSSFRPYGPGLDFLLGRRYFVGAGSTLQGKTYTSNGGDLLHVPPRLIEVCSRSVDESTKSQDPSPDVEINEERAEKRALQYLEKEMSSPIPQGSRNVTAYQVAARFKDYGVSEARAIELLRDWDKKVNHPPLNGELEAAVGNAYRYTKNFAGNLAPEKQFPPIETSSAVLSPFEQINREYALITGGKVHVIHETFDVDGFPIITRQSIDDFHIALAPSKMQIETEKGLKTVAVSRKWIEYPERRAYIGVCFKPEQDAGSNYYNLWRGFSYKPKEGTHYALEMFLEHTQENVCNNDPELFRWLIGYFAHLIQKPYQKPRTGLVFHGAKGVGKNALVDCVGALIDKHYIVTSSKEDLSGRFNAQLENCLLLVLNEVTWGGEKAADGVLKNLVDGGKKFRIEHKGVNVFYAPNIMRPVIIGNEPWLVSATEDERRYGVFSVNNNRRGDIDYFEKMRLGMEEGGYRHLLHYLKSFNLSGINVNKAPTTEGLKEQQRHSLAPLDSWWLDCLVEGSIAGGDFDGWPSEVNCRRFRAAFHSYKKLHNIGTRISDTQFGVWLNKLFPDIVKFRPGTNTRELAYQLPSLDQCRKRWQDLKGFGLEHISRA